MAIQVALPSNTAFKKDGTVVKGMDTVTLGFGTAADVDITSFDSVDDFQEFASGLKDAGEFSVSGGADFSDAGVQAVFGDFGTSPTPTDTYTIELGTIGADTVIYTVTAYPKSPDNVGATVGGKVTLGFTFKISGKPTLVAGATTIF